MRYLLVVAFLFLGGGCGGDSSCDVLPHVCTDTSCCDPVCENAVEGYGCSNPGYGCTLFEDACTCDVGDHLWHCHGDLPMRDLSIPHDLETAHDLRQQD